MCPHKYHLETHPVQLETADDKRFKTERDAVGTVKRDATEMRREKKWSQSSI
jgi:hypothetical protein